MNRNPAPDEPMPLTGEEADHRAHHPRTAGGDRRPAGPRHLIYRPFVAGDLQGLAGEYPVWVHQPLRPQDVPSAVARAWHEAVAGRGSALVIVPSDDWSAPADDVELAAPAVLRHAASADPTAVEELAVLLEGSRAPDRTEPLVLEVAVAPDTTFEP